MALVFCSCCGPAAFRAFCCVCKLSLSRVSVFCIYCCSLSGIFVVSATSVLVGFQYSVSTAALKDFCGVYQFGLNRVSVLCIYCCSGGFLWCLPVESQ